MNWTTSFRTQMCSLCANGLSMAIRYATLISLTSVASFSVAELQDNKEIKQSGRHGGQWLQQDDVALELTIFEAGIPPEMRVYVYQDQELILPSDAEVTVQLKRLGNEVDQILFEAEGKYLIGNKIIREPHSYDVFVNAKINGRSYAWDYESHEGRTTIPSIAAERLGIETEVVGPRRLGITDEMFGVIAAPNDKVFHINAPYPGLVEAVLVQVGDVVTKGQALIRLKNTATQQLYTLSSPTAGEVTERLVNVGDRTDQGDLLQVSDLTNVWVELSAFPENVEQIEVGQLVEVRDLHEHEVAEGRIKYVAPQMTGGHIARARAVIENSGNHWRPGMHVKAAVQVDVVDAELAVKVSAIQRFRGRPVVFAQYGDLYEVRMTRLGKSDGEYVEVLEGIAPDTRYVTDNSFLIKADVLKDGASHDH